MAIRIGSLKLDNRVILAPMSGVTDLPYRRLSKKHGAGLVVSEMIASRALIKANRRTLKMSENCFEEFPMAIQLAGCDPTLMADAAKLGADLGAAIIDINMGCPVKKVTKGHAGSALMRDQNLAGKIISSVVKAVNLPVTLKMRTGWDDRNRNAPELAKIAESMGIKMITVHGRTRCQFYNGKADWGFIRKVKESVNIPIIGNGDVRSVEDASRLLEQSGADGVMIGRGSYGRPWFLKQVSEFIESRKKLEQPSLKTQFNIVEAHYEDILEHYGLERGNKIARKHIGWYTKGLHGSAEFRSKINSANTVRTAKLLLSDYYHSLMERVL